MKRTRTHEIDEEAMRILKLFLPVAWVVTEQHPDYGKDFLVEIVEDQELTGFNFFIQLKGEESIQPIKDGKCVSFPLKKKHAIYYADKLKQPIFLVVIDISRRVGYWLFLQKHLLENWPHQNWRFKKSVSVQLPSTNTLADIDALRTAVKEAHDYMVARHPAAIPSAIKAERERLEKLDPRIGIRIEATDAGRQITAVPKEPIEFTIAFKGEPDQVDSKVDDLVGRGLPVSFRPDEIEVSGSPLLAEAMKNGGTLVSAQIIPAMVCLTARDETGQEIGRLDGISGHVAGGLKECRFEGALGASPINMTITIDRESKKGPVRFGFDTKRWHGQPIGVLAHFPQIEAFFEAVKRCKTVGFDCQLQGNDLFGATIQADSLDFLKRVADFLVVLTKAREVAHHYGVNPPLPPNFGPAQGQEIAHLHQLIKDGEYRKRVPGARITINLRPQHAGIKRLLQSPKGIGVPLEICPIEDQRHPFLGMEVNIGKIKHCFTETTLATRPATLRARLARSKCKNFSVEFTCSTTCEMVVQAVPQETTEKAGASS
jgi:hypothetical protein